MLVKGAKQSYTSGDGALGANQGSTFTVKRKGTKPESVQDASQGAAVADEGSKVDAEGCVARDKGMAGT